MLSEQKLERENRERKWKLLEVKPRAPEPGSGQTLEETEAELPPGGPAVLEGSSATSDADAVSHRDGDVEPAHPGAGLGAWACGVTNPHPHPRPGEPREWRAKPGKLAE